MGHVQHGVPIDLVRMLVSELRLTVAVETGTFRGESSALLAREVPQVWSIEADDLLHDAAVKAYASVENIRFLLGDSPSVLQELRQTVRDPAVFWLDAHVLPYSADVEAQCPVLAEIRALNLYDAAADSCVLIDDARLFLGPHTGYEGADWPRLLELIDELRVFDRYITILDDVIVAVPRTAQRVVDAWWLQLSRSRNGNEYYSDLWLRAQDPSPARAAKSLIRAVARRLARLRTE